jgi:hypothetical protein
MDWDRSHPVMRHVEFAKVAIEDALRVRPLAAGRPLVEAVGGPPHLRAEEPERKAIFLGFDLFKSDFPLRVAFPLILSNGLRWLHPAGLDQSSLQLAAGQPILLPVEHGVSGVTVTTPSGRRVKAQVTRGMVSFTETDEIGIYTLTTTRGDLRVAVNLMDADESNLAPRPLPAPTHAAPAAGRTGARAAGALAAARGHRGGPARDRRGALLAAAERGPAARPARDERPLGPRPARGARGRAPPRPPQAHAASCSRSPQRGSSSSTLRQRQPRGARSRVRFSAEAAKHEKSGDRHGVIVFGQEAVVDQPLQARTPLERPRAIVNGRGTNISQAISSRSPRCPPGKPTAS